MMIVKVWRKTILRTHLNFLVASFEPLQATNILALVTMWRKEKLEMEVENISMEFPVLKDGETKSNNQKFTDFRFMNSLNTFCTFTI